MRKCATLLIAMSICGTAFADDVRDAYQEVYASAVSTLDLHRKCEYSLRRNEMKPCTDAQKAYEDFKEKSTAFLSSVKPEDLFQHVTPDEMNQLTSLNNQIGESMDNVSAYLGKRN